MSAPYYQRHKPAPLIGGMYQVMPGGGFPVYGGATGVMGNNATMFSTARTGIGIANAFTISLWTIVGVATDDTYLDIGPASGDINRIKIRVLGSVANDPLNVLLYDGAGTLFKDYRPVSLFPSASVGYFYHLVIRWDGTDLAIWCNGAAIADTATTDDAPGVAMDDSNARIIAVNCDTTGADNAIGGWPHSVAIWNEALTAAEITSLTNQGFPGWTNLTTNFIDYTSAANLVHWWRFGDDLSSTDSRVKDQAPLANPSIPLSLGVHPNSNLPGIAANVNSFPVGGGLRVVSSEEFQSDTQSIGIANEWTIGFFGKSDVVTNEDRIINLQASGSTVNQIYMTHQSDIANDPLRIVIADSSGTVFKSYLYNFAFVNDVNNAVTCFHHHMCTWDGTNLLYYRDGQLILPDTKTTDNSGTQTDTARRFTIFGADNLAFDTSANCFVSAFIWDKVLRAEEIAFIFNNYCPLIDLTKDQYKYNSSANLKYWWRFGQPFGSTGSGDALVTNYVPNPSGADITFSETSMASVQEIMYGATYYGNPNVKLNLGSYLRTPVASTLGIDNSWSIYHHYTLRGVAGGSDCIFDIKESGSNNNRIQFNYIDDAVDYMELKLWDSAGVLFKEYRYTGVSMVITTQNDVIITWNGTTLTLYNGGLAVAASTTPTNNAGTMTDSERIVYLGADADALASAANDNFVGEMVMWSSALPVAEVQQLFVDRPGYFDRRLPHGGYTSASSLKHWWRVGCGDIIGPETVAPDYVISGTPLHMKTEGGLKLYRIAANRG